MLFNENPLGLLSRLVPSFVGKVVFGDILVAEIPIGMGSAAP